MTDIAPLGLIDRWQKIARRIRVPLGFLFAAIYLWRARPTPTSILLSLLLVVPGLLLRGYASGCVKKNAELTDNGPYAYTRNPLYLGSILIALGFAAASRSLLIVAALVVFFVVIYVPVIALEEKFLRATFAGFDDYCRRVPRLIPRLTPAVAASASGGFSAVLYRKHREYNALVGSGLIYLALCLRLLL